MAPNIASPPFLVSLYHTCERIARGCNHSYPHHAEGVYIINSAGIAYHHAEGVHIINDGVVAYHQPVGLHIIKPQGKYTLKRDDIQGAALPPLDDMHRTLCGDDIPSLRLG